MSLCVAAHIYQWRFARLEELPTHVDEETEAILS